MQGGQPMIFVPQSYLNHGAIPVYAAGYPPQQVTIIPGPAPPYPTNYMMYNAPVAAQSSNNFYTTQK